MADYSTASSAAQSALESAMAGGVEEYSKGDVRVKLGTGTQKVRDAAFLEGMAARRSAGGLLKVGRKVDPFV